MPVADNVVTYRLRIDLSGAEPPLQHELEVVSDLFLDELQWIIQVAFGWQDRHPHQSIPEDEVRLDEVLVRPGDKLLGWAHLITLETVLPRSASMPNARCVADQPDRRAG